jgi:hypothetical protein
MCQNKRFHIEDLIEGVDFYWEEIDGVKLRVWTKEYLQMIRVKCCKSGCRHCPWGYNKKIDTENGTSTKI